MAQILQYKPKEIDIKSLPEETIIHKQTIHKCECGSHTYMMVGVEVICEMCGKVAAIV